MKIIHLIFNIVLTGGNGYLLFKFATVWPAWILAISILINFISCLAQIKPAWGEILVKAIASRISSGKVDDIPKS